MKSNKQQGPKIQTDIRTLPVHTCDCGCNEFIQVVQLRRCPALLSPTGAATLISAPYRIACCQCGKQPEWKLEEQPRIITLQQEEKKDVPKLPLEGSVPGVGTPDAPEGGQQ